MELICPGFDDPNYKPAERSPGYVHKDFISVTFKNFGLTPAYDVRDNRANQDTSAFLTHTRNVVNAPGHDAGHLAKGARIEALGRANGIGKAARAGVGTFAIPRGVRLKSGKTLASNSFFDP